MLRALVYILCIHFSILSYASSDLRLNSSENNIDWDSFFTQKGRNQVDFGVQFTGKSPYLRNHKTLFAPASNSKIFTTAASLRFLGPDYQIPTQLNWHPLSSEDLFAITKLQLIGSGDPTWGMEEHGESLQTRLDHYVNYLFSQGVREVHGQIQVVSSDSRWDQLRFPEGWEQEDYYSCYGALAQSFNLNINCARLNVLSVNKAVWIEKGVPTEIQLDLKESHSTKITIIPIVNENNISIGFTLTGTWGKNQSPLTYIFPVHNTKQWVKNLFVDSLLKHTIQYFPQSDRVALGEIQSKTFYSPPLAEIIKPFMKKSINVVGSAIIKQIALHLDYPHDDLLEGGQWALKEFSYQINDKDLSNEIQLWDGSGVSRDSYVTPNAITEVLLEMKKRSYFSFFWDSLPIAGVDGTLKNRMKSTVAEGVLRAKTGSLRGVYNLSGYIPVYNSIGEAVEFFPFVILTKTTSAYKSRSRRAQDKAGALLVEINNTMEPMDLLGDLFLASY